MIHELASIKRLDLRLIIDLSSDVIPLGPSNKAKHAIRRGIKYLQFPSDENLKGLTHYIAKREHIEAGNILFSNSTLSLIHRVILAYKPRSISIFPPLPDEHKKMLSLYHGECTLVENTPFEKTIDRDSILEAIHCADMVFLSNPHWFTGSILPEEEMFFAVKEADKCRKPIIVDESYIDFTDLAPSTAPIVNTENGLIIRTFSIYYGLEGLPVAYGIGSSKMIERIKNFFMGDQISTLSYMAALASLKDKGYRTRTLRFIKEALLKNRIIIKEYRDVEGLLLIKFPVKSHKFNARVIKTLKLILKNIDQR